MKTKAKIVERKVAALNLADSLLAQANKAKNEQDRDMYVRMRNQILNEIYTLEWVLAK